MTILDDIVGIAVFFTVNSLIAPNGFQRCDSALYDTCYDFSSDSDWCYCWIANRTIIGTIAAAAIINEFIAVIAAKKGFELSGEIK